MKVEIYENTLNVFTEDRELIRKVENTSYVIYPDNGKYLRNKLNGTTSDTLIGLGSRDQLSNYEEIEIK